MFSTLIIRTSFFFSNFKNSAQANTGLFTESLQVDLRGARVKKKRSSQTYSPCPQNVLKGCSDYQTQCPQLECPCAKMSTLFLSATKMSIRRCPLLHMSSAENVRNRKCPGSENNVHTDKLTCVGTVVSRES